MTELNTPIEQDPMYRRVPRSAVVDLRVLCEKYGSGGILVSALCSLIGPSEAGAAVEGVKRLYGKMSKDDGFDEVLVDETS